MAGILKKELTRRYQEGNVRNALNQLVKLALSLSMVNLLISCNVQSQKAQSKETLRKTSQPTLSTPLKAGVEELRVLRIKIQGGVSQKEYGEDITDLVNVVDKAYGDPKVLAAVRAAVKGHQLAIAFWRCDRAVGYNELHQCQDKVLKQVFVKYPDIEAQAKAAVAGENLPYISAGLEQDAVMQAIWMEIGEDTEEVLQLANPASNPTKTK